MIGLYELLGNPTTYLIEPPGPLSEARCTQYRSEIYSILTGFTKLHMILVVLVKKMSVLMNFLMQNANLVAVLSKTYPNCAGHV